MAARKKTEAAPKLPKGFRPARTRLDGFFEREGGNSVTGVLRGAFTTKGKFGEKSVFRIEVTEGTTLARDKDDVVELEAGAIIGLDETGYTKVLAEVATGTPVFVRYEGKGEGKQDPHVFTVGVAE